MKYVTPFALIVASFVSNASAFAKDNRGPVGARLIWNLKDPFTNNECNALHTLAVVVIARGGYDADFTDQMGLCADTILRAKYEKEGFVCTGDSSYKEFLTRLAKSLGAPDVPTLNKGVIRGVCLEALTKKP